MERSHQAVGRNCRLAAPLSDLVLSASNRLVTFSPVSYPPPLREGFLPEPTVEEMNITIALEMPYTWKLNNISATLPSVPVYQSGGKFGMDKPISIVKVALHDVVDVLLVSNFSCVCSMCLCRGCVCRDYW